MSALTTATLYHNPENGVIHSHCLEKLTSLIKLNGWALQRRRNMFPVRYELGFYIPENGILHLSSSFFICLIASQRHIKYKLLRVKIKYRLKIYERK
jgi:hypothetical protein